MGGMDGRLRRLLTDCVCGGDYFFPFLKGGRAGRRRRLWHFCIVGMAWNGRTGAGEEEGPFF